MAFIDRLLGNLPDVLGNRSTRLQLISSNLANADTPGYKARDIDFESLYNSQKAGLQLQGSDDRHINGRLSRSNDELASLYRVPHQNRIDGNTVETDIERMEFMENAIRYQATLGFMDGKIKSYMGALRGE